MSCDTQVNKARNQTLQERAEEVREALKGFARGIVTGRIKIRVGPQGSVAFEGLTQDERKGITDGCIYRLMVKKHPEVLPHIMRAETLAGRKINLHAMHHGWHSHDGGKSWETHKHGGRG